MKYFTIAFMLFLTALASFAQSPSPVLSPAFAAPSSAIADFITAHMVSITTYGGLLFSEVIMRVVPSQKPLSLLYAVSAVLKWLSQLSSTIAAALDGIVGQNKSS